MDKKLIGVMCVGAMIGIMQMVTNNPKDNEIVEEPNTTIEMQQEQEQQITPKARKEKICEQIKNILIDNLGENYTVEVVMDDEYSCNIAVQDNNHRYSNLTKGQKEQLAKETGLEDTIISFCNTSQELFNKEGYKGVIVTIANFDADQIPFMLTNIAGAIYY